MRTHSDTLEHCEIDEKTYSRVVSAWLTDREGGADTVDTLFLGRAVTFPWISRHLAHAALRNPQEGGQAHEENRWVAALLSQPDMLARLQVPFQASHRVIRGVSVEKILWGHAADHTHNPEDGTQPVPFDALVWIRIELAHN